MANTAGRVLCRTCGKEVSIYDAKEYNLGRRKVYECYECRKEGTTQADGFHVQMCQKMIKECGK